MGRKSMYPTEVRERACLMAWPSEPSTKSRSRNIDHALASGVRKHVVLADAGYGDSTDFREQLTSRGLRDVVGGNGEPVVWSPTSNPVINSRPAGTRGRPRTRFVDAKHPPMKIAALAEQLTYKKITWREGSRGWQTSAFAAVRVRTVHGHANHVPPGDEKWLLVERSPMTRSGSEPSFRPYPATHRCARSSDSRSCAGASSATTKS